MSEQKIFKGLSSTALHAASNQNAEEAHLVPIYATSTFTYEATEEGMQRFSGIEKNKIYSRWANPTCSAAEEVIEALEGFGINDKNGKPLQLKALLHASGQAAMTTLFLSNLKASDALLSHYSLYGGTYELFHKVLPDAGIEVHIVDMRDTAEVSKALEQH